MTIADAFNEITVAQGGTPNYSGTIAAAIDALNDALAGSDQPAETTIEGAVRLLGQHIGGSVSGTIEITENGEGIDVAQYAYADVNVSGGGTEYGGSVSILPRLYGEPYESIEGAFVLSEIGDAAIGNIMGDIMWFDVGKNFASYGNVNVGFSTPDNYTATVKVNDGDPQPVSKFFNEEWETYTYSFTVPNVTQEDFVYLDFAE